MNYRGFTKVIKKNHYPLPLIFGLFDQLGHARIFTKINVKGAYNLIGIKEKDKWNTTFRIRYDHFEYRVMPFSLTMLRLFFNT
jgi:hypothetical protein